MFSLPSLGQGNPRISVVRNNVIKGGCGRSFSFAFVSRQMPENLTCEIERRGVKIKRLPPFSALDAPVSSHPDMLLLTLGGKLILPEEYYRENITLFEGIDVICAKEAFSADYPHDVPLNALETDKGIFCLEKSASERIKEFGGKIINVAQGYARCSCCKIDENSLITADPSIAVAAKDAGCDVLEVCSAQIRLPGYPYGFIGGCSAAIGNEILFFGKLEEHPDCQSIEEFIYSHGKKPVSLTNEPLTDYGGIVFI